ncbi:MAG: hypothetical protein A2V70_10630 [Planctomycetes bacterium RBG_13_63_9]|nr:MAG: hypothetical protein A2V70_10630 [Planctomycetes bacterium RBG_13_63_9]
MNLALPRVAWHRPSLATAGRASRRNVVRKSEYQALLRPIVEKYAQESWEYWRDRIGAEPICFDGETDEGKQYQVEVEAFWDGKAEGDIRVLISIDDGRWRAFCPVCESFVVAPDQSSQAGK